MRVKNKEKRAAPAAPQDERLPLTPQQAAQVLASQTAAQEARERASIVLRGVLAAAGIDQADVTGGELAAAEPFLTIRRRR